MTPSQLELSIGNRPDPGVAVPIPAWLSTQASRGGVRMVAVCLVGRTVADDGLYNDQCRFVWQALASSMAFEFLLDWCRPVPLRALASCRLQSGLPVACE